MKIIQKASVLLGALLGLAGTASATAFVESGDAGQSLAAAQVIYGSGAVTSIAGTFASGNDADLYKIRIDTPGLFHVSAVGTPSDGLLFLFDANGKGVVYRDDKTHQGANYGDLTNQFVLASGYYYLGISLYDNLPLSSGGLIFPESTATGNSGLEFQATGPGGAFALANWNNAGPGIATGNYTITLQGVQAVPEPSSIALMAIALGGIALFRRRRSI